MLGFFAFRLPCLDSATRETGNFSHLSGNTNVARRIHVHSEQADLDGFSLSRNCFTLDRSDPATPVLAKD